MPRDNEMSLREAALRYGLNIHTVKQWAKRGKFATRQDEYTPLLFVTVEDFENWLADPDRGRVGRPAKD